MFILLKKQKQPVLNQEMWETVHKDGSFRTEKAQAVGNYREVSAPRSIKFVKKGRRFIFSLYICIRFMPRGPEFCLPAVKETEAGRKRKGCRW